MPGEPHMNIHSSKVLLSELEVSPESKVMEIPEIVLNMFAFFSRRDKGSWAKVNSYCKILAEDNQLWWKYFEYHFRVPREILQQAALYLECFNITLKSLYRNCHLLYGNDLLVKEDLKSSFSELWQLVLLSGNINAIQHYVNANIDQLDLLRDSEERNLLHYLALIGNEQLLQRYCQSAADLIENDKQGKSILHYAVISGNERTIKFCLKKLNIHEPFQPELNLLQCAFLSGNIALIQHFLAKEVPITDLDGFANTMLHYAAAGGRVAAVKICLEKNLDPSHTNRLERTPLFIAVTNGCVSAFQHLYDVAPKTLNQPDWKGRTPFWMACFNHWMEMFDLFRQYFTESVETYINQADNAGVTPFYCATKEGYEDIVRYLLKYGAMSVINQSTTVGNTPLISAAFHGHREIVKLLCDALGEEAPIAAIHTNIRGQTPLYAAALEGHEYVFHLLLQYYVPSLLTKATNDGTTVLHAAVQSGKIGIVRLILNYLGKEAEAIVNKANDQGQTPLSIAASGGNKQLVTLLMQHGARNSLNLPDSQGMTPLMVAIPKANVELISFLLEEDASSTIHLSCSNGVTALYIAAYCNKPEIVQLLLKYGARKDLQMVDIKGRSIVFTAVATGDVNNVSSIINALEEEKEELALWVNRPDIHGLVPLALAAHQGNVPVMELLIEYGARQTLHHRCQLNETPLMIAVAANQYDSVRYLLTIGAYTHIDATDIDGNTSLMVAAQIEAMDIFKLLLAYGADITIENNMNESVSSILSHTTWNDSVRRLIKYKQLFDDACLDLFSNKEKDAVHIFNEIKKHNSFFFDQCILVKVQQFQVNNDSQKLKNLCVLKVVYTAKDPELILLIANLANEGNVDLPLKIIGELYKKARKKFEQSNNIEKVEDIDKKIEIFNECHMKYSFCPLF
jgi:ankyrin repeat protein